MNSGFGRTIQKIGGMKISSSAFVNHDWRRCLLTAFLSFVFALTALASDTAVTAVANLSDPAKIATLKSPRAANDRLLKILAWLHEGLREGTLPSKTIDEAQKLNGDNGPHGQLVKAALLANVEYAERAALFTPENLALMKSGKSPLVPSGSFAGERYEVDHIIPVAEFPQLGNELANLILLPRTLNRRKSAAVKQHALDLAQKMVAAGLLTPEDVQRLRRLTRD